MHDRASLVETHARGGERRVVREDVVHVRVGVGEGGVGGEGGEAAWRMGVREEAREGGGGAREEAGGAREQGGGHGRVGEVLSELLSVQSPPLSHG